MPVCRGLFGAAEGKDEFQTASTTVAHAYAPAHVVDATFHDRQSESGSADFARAPRIHAVETVEQMRDVLFPHAHTVVVEGESVVAFCLVQQRNPYFRAL